MDGWIKLHRKFIDWEWYADMPTKSLAIHYLLKVNSEVAKWQGIEIGIGEFVTSYARLSHETGLSTRQIRTANQHLEKSGFSTSKATNRFTIVSVCNYDNYQSPKRRNRQAERQTTDKQPTTNKNKENNISSISSIISEKTKNENELNFGKTEWLTLDEIADYLRSDQIWLESVAMNNHVTTLDAVTSTIADFILELRSQDITRKDKHDTRRHFANWFRKRLTIKNAQINGNTNQKNAGRRAETNARIGGRPEYGKLERNPNRKI